MRICLVGGRVTQVIAFKVKGDVAARMLQSAVPENLNDGIDDYASQNRFGGQVSNTLPTTG